MDGRGAIGELDVDLKLPHGVVRVLVRTDGHGVGDLNAIAEETATESPPVPITISNRIAMRDIWYMIQYILENKIKSSVRSRISSKLIGTSCVGYSDRACYGFYMIS